MSEKLAGDMESLKKIRLSDRVVDVIKQIIHEEKFTPGAKFYSEHDLTSKLEVSRSSIREAVRILEVSGIVTVKHGKGIFISEKTEKGFEAVSGWLKDHEDSLDEHFEVRLIIEPKAAAYAARNADSEDVQKLEEICRMFRSSSEENQTAELIKIDEKFHLQLAKSTKNRTLYYVMRTMTKTLTEGWVSSLHVPGRIKKTIGEHRCILEAVAAHDQERAETEMLRHLQNALADIKATMQPAANE